MKLPESIRIDKRVPYAVVLSGIRFALAVPGRHPRSLDWGAQRAHPQFPTQARMGVCK